MNIFYNICYYLLSTLKPIVKNYFPKNSPSLLGRSYVTAIKIFFAIIKTIFDEGTESDIGFHIAE